MAQPYIANIPFKRKIRGNQGATIKIMQEIYRFNGIKWPSCGNRYTYRDEFYDDLNSRPYIFLPREYQPMFLYGTIVRLPTGEKFHIKNERDLYDLEGVCDQRHPCEVIYYYDDGVLVENTSKGKIEPTDWYQLCHNLEEEEERGRRRASDRDFIAEKGGYDPRAGNVLAKNILAGKRKITQTLAGVQSELSRKFFDIDDEEPVQPSRSSMRSPVRGSRRIIEEETEESDEESEEEESDDEFIEEVSEEDPDAAYVPPPKPIKQRRPVSPPPKPIKQRRPVSPPSGPIKQRNPRVSTLSWWPPTIM